jgi:hypothetical protein
MSGLFSMRVGRVRGEAVWEGGRSDVSFINVSDGLDLINLDMVRSIQVKDFKKVIAITFVYADGSEDMVTVSLDRWAVLEGALLERVVA